MRYLSPQPESSPRFLRKCFPRQKTYYHNINQLQPTSSITFNDNFTYLAFPSTIVDLLTFLFLFGRIWRTHQLLQLPTISLSTTKITTTLFFTRSTFFNIFHVSTSLNIALIFLLFILIVALLSYLFFLLITRLKKVSSRDGRK